MNHFERAKELSVELINLYNEIVDLYRKLEDIGVNQNRLITHLANDDSDVLRRFMIGASDIVGTREERVCVKTRMDEVRSYLVKVSEGIESFSFRLADQSLCQSEKNNKLAEGVIEKRKRDLVMMNQLLDDLLTII